MTIYLYAVLLLHKVGKEISIANIGKVLYGAGIDPDEHDVARITNIVKTLEGVDIDKALAEFQMTAPKPKPKEELKEEKKEDEVATGLRRLFDL